jgi:hypothetical protein
MMASDFHRGLILRLQKVSDSSLWNCSLRNSRLTTQQLHPMAGIQAQVLGGLTGGMTTVQIAQTTHENISQVTWLFGEILFQIA